MHTIRNYIGGAFNDPIGGEWLDVYDPSTGAVFGRAPRSDARDVEAAVSAAAAAFPAWSALPRADRSAMLLRVSALIDRDRERLALAESMDNGKPVALARSIDIPRASANFSFFATAILHEQTEAYQTDARALNITLRAPIGIAGCISPWNLPLYLFTWKIAPALAAGNCVVAKPSEVTPLTAFLLSELCVEAGMPPGVLNIVHGDGPGVGAAITAHPMIPAISFTGGTRTGALIAATAAPMFKKLSLELGGKNPTLVFADCDFEAMLETVLRSSFTNQGEICLCGSRILVERSIYGRFRDAFVERVRKLRVGDPMDPATEQGALVSEAHMRSVLSYIDAARSDGGTILCGGGRFHAEGRCAEGWFVSPTVIEDLPQDARCNMEEIFGPVVTLLPFDSDDEAVAMANATRYGLAASVWTRDLRRAHDIAARLECGIAWINCWMVRDLRTPFGGVKQSGVGREGGTEALRFFTEAKTVCIATGS